MNTVSRLTILIVSGVLLGLSLNHFFFWWLSLVAIVPLFYSIKEHSNKKDALIDGFLFGFAFSGTFLFWFWHALPLDGLGIESGFFGVFTVFLNWSLTSLVFSLFFSVFAFLVWILRFNWFSTILLFPLIWALLEFFRMTAFSLFVFGDGASLLPYFSTGFLGYALANNNFLLDYAFFGGVFLLSFLAVLSNTLIFKILISENKSFSVLAVASLLILFGISSGVIARGESGGEVTVSAIHTNHKARLFPDDKERERRFELHMNLLQEAARENPDVIVFPEQASLIKVAKEKNILNKLRGIAGDTLIVDSHREEDFGKVSSRITYFNSSTGEETKSDKKLLVSQGEYTPALYGLIGGLLGKGDTIDRALRHRSYTSGTLNELPAFHNDAKVGALFCSELLSPTLYNRFVENEANLLVNVASQSWFHDSKILRHQIENIAQVRAAENNRFLIYAANFAPSFVVSNKGELVVSTESEEKSVLTFEVNLLEKQSFYNTFISKF
ncbi:MAG: apolipoprotein N-acyltransferase [Candidatus Pacebacteria bacterium]|jgi:apolipoprotein N-acyltransferase|nr:apolipoprotein N-acyltransferase [bacterium]MDP6527997.1 apolipoprotein N-acyltransferase [Candidatus Paceibacterota bacterium]MDP6659745.1 apolipoprotein N-acyltransferase [Candidatus Paceibacterota bacterium]|tara:strand:+ start:11495 stop:12991 length:1497 start_codon:yes stop_codon:yes gene_type:complete